MFKFRLSNINSPSWGDHLGTKDKTRVETNQKRNCMISIGLCSCHRRANIRSDSRDSRSGFLFDDQKALMRNSDLTASAMSSG
jgi:hypothetical protein